MDDILFFGSFFPHEEEKIIIADSRASVQNAANLLQWDYIDGIEAVLGRNIRLMTRMVIGTYPWKFRRAFISTHLFHHAEGSNDLVIGFPNTLLIRQIMYPYVANRHLLNWAQQEVGKDQKVLIAYAYSAAPAILALKKKFPQVFVAWILLDLPCYTDLDHSKSFAYYLKHRLAMRSLREAMHYVDVIVPITEQMREKLDPQHVVKSIVIEGMAKQRIISSYKPDGIFQIAYTGTLTAAYGILNLVEAVQAWEDKNIRLVICGSGETEEQIRQAAVCDKRIVYRGNVSMEEAYEVQCSSTILVNPRRNDDEYTKYSFPSKILQYMSTGRPVLCYRLDGFPQEYDQYLLYVKEWESLADALQRIKKMTGEELYEVGIKARDFVQKSKNNVAQAQRLMNAIAERRG